jgi:hypothetical protein
MRTLPLALPASPHQMAPRDRAIWIVANVLTRGDCFTDVDRYEGYAQWSEQSQDWQNWRGMSIRVDYDAELNILEWCELKERAARATEEETSISTFCQHYVSDWDPSATGWICGADIQHRPTLQTLARLEAGPFATRAQALGELAVLLTKITAA